jgi:hypothetical protein
VSRRNVECFEPGSPAQHIPRSKAFSLVNSREAEWTDDTCTKIRKFRKGYSVRGLSARLGEAIALMPKGAFRTVFVAEVTGRPMEAS